MSQLTKPRKKLAFQQQSVHPPPKVSKLPTLFTNTTCTPDARTSTREAMYQFFEDEELRVMERVVTIEDSYPVFDTTYNDLANSFLHRIVSRSNIFPYIDMIRWVLNHINIANKNFMNKRNTVTGSFTSKYLT